MGCPRNVRQTRGASARNLGGATTCRSCHTSVNLTVSYRAVNTTSGTIPYPFFNNGLYNIDGEGSYPAQDQGLYDLTLDPGDRRLFRAPTTASCRTLLSPAPSRLRLRSYSASIVHSPSPRKWPMVRASEVVNAPCVGALRPDGS